MARRPPFPSPTARRLRRDRRTQRLLANRAVRDALVSVAGLVRRPVRISGGAEVGRLADLVARWDGQPYPPITGLVVRVARRLAFVPASQVADLGRPGITLTSAQFNLRDFERRPGEVLLSGDVLDHQLVDVDGVRVVRASDLYLAPVSDGWRLVGVDIGYQSLLRRLGPARWRVRPTPDRVIDWAAIQPFGVDPGPLRLRRENQTLARLRPSELADLLEELGRPERNELLETLERNSAADALEEMEPDELRALLRDLPVRRVADLLGAMEPDEAADALRDLDEDELEEIFAAMAPAVATQLRPLLSYPESTAGGLMTTRLLVGRCDETVGAVRARLAAADERLDLSAVVLVDEDNRVVDDISVVDLFVVEPERKLEELASDAEPVTVLPSAPLTEVIDRLIDSRQASLLVVDDDRHPVGRIMADDVIDALVPTRGRYRLHVRVP
ncbi:MAG TPA: CBS domain-containing protein [Acidimicrobiia bacterium]|nr:CBS domain-containing protein [Acidimicrobiia bacterium]